MTTKDFLFDIKAVHEDGTFEGWLSVYDVVDLGRDVVRPGAFTKTIQESKGQIPMLWQHDTHQPIGHFEVSERPEGLWVKGVLLLAIQKAQEAYELIKARVIKGLSIGYKAIPDKTKMVSGVRNLFEVVLYEGSIVTFPMLPVAQIQRVKEGGYEHDFPAELKLAEVTARGFILQEALASSLAGIASSKSEAAEKIAESAESIELFREQYLASLPQMLEVAPADSKAGRRHSAATRVALQEAVSRIQALLAEETESTSEEAAPLLPEAADKGIEPEAFHSLLNGFHEAVASAIRA